MPCRAYRFFVTFFYSENVKENAVTVNGVPVKGSYKVKAEDEVAFLLPEAVEPGHRAGKYSAGYFI